MSPFSESDAEELLALFRAPDVRRYLLDDSLVSAEWVREEIEASKARFCASGAGLCAVRLTGQTGIAGFVGFRGFLEPPRLQLLYGLLPIFWGEGLATEVAERICKYAFEDLDFAEILAATDVPNKASASVLGRLGMRLERTTSAGPSGTALYRLDRESWKRRCYDGAL